MTYSRPGRKEGKLLLLFTSRGRAHLSCFHHNPFLRPFRNETKKNSFGHPLSPGEQVAEVRETSKELTQNSTLSIVMVFKRHRRAWDHPRNPGDSWLEQRKRAHGPLCGLVLLPILCLLLSPSLPCLAAFTASYPLSFTLKLGQLVIPLGTTQNQTINQRLPKGIDYPPPSLCGPQATTETINLENLAGPLFNHTTPCLG